MLAVCIRVFTKEGESFEFLNVASFFCRHKSQYFLCAIFVALQSFSSRGGHPYAQISFQKLTPREFYGGWRKVAFLFPTQQGLELFICDVTISRQVALPELLWSSNPGWLVFTLVGEIMVWTISAIDQILIRYNSVACHSSGTWDVL